MDAPASSVVSAGVDTAKLCWRLDVESPAGRAADALATVPTSRGRLLPEKVGGHRVLWYPAAGLLAAEGHPAGEGHLASANALPSYVAAMNEQLREAGIDVPEEHGAFGYSRHGFEGFGRLDVTVNLATAGTSAGLAIMSGVAAIQPDQRLQTVVTRQPGGRAIETVTWRGQRGIVARTYDKATESLSGPRATLIRLEDQRRWGSQHRREVAELEPARVRDIFCRRFAPLWQAAKGVTVVTSNKAAHLLQGAVHREEITAGQAIDVAGHLFLEQQDVRVGSQPTRWRHRRLARTLGLVLVDGELAEQQVEVNLADVLESCMDASAWGTD